MTHGSMHSRWMRRRKGTGEKKAGKLTSVPFHRKPVSSGEFLSGFYENDRLVPVITLVILFDSSPWTGSVSLCDMFSAQDKDVL